MQISVLAVMLSEHNVAAISSKIKELTDRCIYDVNIAFLFDNNDEKTANIIKDIFPKATILFGNNELCEKIVQKWIKKVDSERVFICYPHLYNTLPLLERIIIKDNSPDASFGVQMLKDESGARYSQQIKRNGKQTLYELMSIDENESVSSAFFNNQFIGAVGVEGVTFDYHRYGKDKKSPFNILKWLRTLIKYLALSDIPAIFWLVLGIVMAIAAILSIIGMFAGKIFFTLDGIFYPTLFMLIILSGGLLLAGVGAGGMQIKSFISRHKLRQHPLIFLIKEIWSSYKKR